jgi:asparagine synthase (glutamine-hydrolysing)
MAFDFKVKRTLRGLDYDPRLWSPIWMAPLDHASLQELFCEPIDVEDLYSEAIEEWENCAQTNLVDKTLQFYTKLYLQNDILVKVDRASMMHSLEVRAPFLDIDVVNFARRIPNDYKLRGGRRKYILKKAFAGVLPERVLDRSKKGFGIPAGEWFRKGALKIDTTGFPMLDASVIKQKTEAHMTGRSDEKAFLWSLYVLNRWQTGCSLPARNG